MYFTHSLAGAVTSKLVIDRVENKFTNKEKSVLWIIGITSSVLPDFDLLYAALNHMANHRYYLTHGLFVYLVIALGIYLFSFTRGKKEFGRKFFKLVPILLLVGVLTHFLLDTIVGGIVLLAPFSYKIYGFGMPPTDRSQNWLLLYLKSPYMILEFFNLVLFSVVLKAKKYLFAKVVALTYFLAAVFAFISISMIFFS